jgi:ketosteroid isomerase-like protein
MSVTEQAVSDAVDALVAAFAATDTEAYFAAFAPEATFVFHPEAARLEDRAEYERLWAGWVLEGWRVESCTSTERRIQILGDTAVVSHRVHTVTSVGGATDESHERETIVFALTPSGSIIAVHEHLSAAPEA